MHNGGLGGWKYIKRRLGERLADKWYLGVVGGTDSEWAFALFLDTLERMGYDPSSQPEDGFGPTVLRKAMLKTISTINELIESIPESVLVHENVDTRSLLNFALTDGHSVICTRYVSSNEDEAASLYYSSGTMWETSSHNPTGQDYQMERSDKGADVVLVASEPLTFERGKGPPSVYPIIHIGSSELIGLAENWVNVPTNSILTIHKESVIVHPIADQYYERNPYHRRSAAYVGSKGLLANEKIPRATPVLSLPVASPSVPQIQDTSKKSFGPTIPFNLARARSSETSTLPRNRTPLSVSEAAPQSSDLRNAAGPALTMSPSQRAPSQGNIKKKRKSLNGLENLPPHGPAEQMMDDEHTSPITPEPRSEYGNPNKIRQFFPELGPGPGDLS